jgi:hypothetical protein
MLPYVLLAVMLLAVAWVIVSVVLTNHLKRGAGPYSDIVRSICKTQQHDGQLDEYGTYIRDGKRYLVEDDGRYAHYKNKKWVVRRLVVSHDGDVLEIRRHYYDLKQDAKVTVRSIERTGEEAELLLSKDDLTTPTHLLDYLNGHVDASDR